MGARIYRLGLFLLACCFTFACGDAKADSLPAKDVDFSDGIDQQEAVILAKSYVGENHLENHVLARGYFLRRPRVYETALADKQPCWCVVLPSKKRDDAWPFFEIGYAIVIDKVSGEVKYAGWNK